ncbi:MULTISPECIES: ABC transporter ATP-binding protein [Bacillus cereus group]|uniref:ABC transporter domain-containing protein n=1 Tax=Bacillus cereus ISP2954 TaxID=1053215 RepID=A0A9W5VEN5_BACCE|nr:MULTISPECIES: ABC transporter ATP-binding protein [Bacillus cereus group]AHZ54528.1 ABC transporter [Bacillus thuringiensis serovar kurstaki str. YBT-1520]AIE37581.1 ABC transporter [Bacillus thuringiensis serovar kurstaki str. HD-1]AIM35073.1 ABC-type antimicrobial peptide transport system [Bacillus thuringiensis serovar kurstaki str. YBT-1520]AJK37862.1 ABC transporter family protein [Bacillus thuringiensis serovar kurstaki]AKJ62440.1 peptide ABC transporter ATP-binding protein [Bacillus 
MEVVRLENVVKTYGEGETQVQALKGINLSIRRGEFVTIVGASGSGKSTLLHILGGLDRPSSGNVFIGDENIYNYKDNELSIFRRRKVGFIFQFFNLIPVLNVQENIALPALLDEEQVDDHYLDEIIRTLGLNERRDHLPSELSGGQQQRVSIGRSLINKPDIILADEPTGNLDTKNTKEVLNLLKVTAKKYNQTVILITHDPAIASNSDRIITITDGMIISDKQLVQSQEKYGGEEY